MKDYLTPKNIFWFGISLIGLIVAWRIYRNLFKDKTGIKQASDMNAEEVKTASNHMLENGDTYYQGAIRLIEFMYNGAIIPWFSNTDEELLGAYLLTVKPEEYNKLDQVYQAAKEAKKHWYTMGTNGTLTQDLVKVFSKKEQKKYMSHLVNLPE